MTSFSIEYRQEALLALRKLDTQDAQRVVDKLSQAKTDPLHFFQRLKNTDLYKLRVGDYRVLARLDIKNGKIAVITLGHRKNIYG